MEVQGSGVIALFAAAPNAMLFEEPPGRGSDEVDAVEMLLKTEYGAKTVSLKSLCKASCKVRISLLGAVSSALYLTFLPWFLSFPGQCSSLSLVNTIPHSPCPPLSLVNDLPSYPNYEGRPLRRKAK